ncbi:MAG: DUF6273 domain-containing protein [Oscillospiraceae bacterium]|nr:DUF6273 domain-containing protein [Oscillospiraceae bacterium]
MSRKQEKPVQFLLPLGGVAVNHCFSVSEDELEENRPEDHVPVLLEKALSGSLSARSLSRHRTALLREAVRSDRAEALPVLIPGRRLSLELFAELFALASEFSSPDARAWLLEYRAAHYHSDEFDAFEQRQLDLELGLTEPDAAYLRKLFRLRYVRSGVCICGIRTVQRVYEIPAAIGGKPVVGVNVAAFYALDPLPRIRRIFTESGSPEQAQGEGILLGRITGKQGSAETPLRWRVLCRKEDRLLLLCEGSVAVLPYHPDLLEVTWESCALRRWLNTVFLPLSFTPEEQERILPTAVSTPDNPVFGSRGGEQSQDRLFLLSVEEASGMLADDISRSSGFWWWLRTPGFDNSFAASVTPDGAVVRIGSFVDTDVYAVRPAMWIRADRCRQNPPGSAEK